MKMSKAILLFGILALVAVNATVFEAERSEDVDLFLEQNQQETVGLLFYDSKAENTDTEGWFSSLTSKILGVFMSQDQFGRSTEDWVEMFDDKLHLMRIDARNTNLMRTREEFNIEEDLPFIVIQDKQRTVLREKVSDDTYDHVRDLLDRRPNILHKTGGAALKSFSLEPDADKDESEPRVIQYFDLDEGEPTNVEEPIQRQYVNWGATDVIGPDGKWMERGRNWVTSYEIPQSGIKSQENPARLSIKDRIKDDPRPKPTQATPTATPVQPKPTTAPIVTRPTVAPVQTRPTATPITTRPTAVPVQSKPTATPVQTRLSSAPIQSRSASNTTTTRPVAAPVQIKSASNSTATRPAAPTASTTRQVPAPTPARPVSTVSTAKPTSTAQPTATQARTASTVRQVTAQPTSTVQPGVPQRNRYHERGYEGYGYPYRGY